MDKVIRNGKVAVLYSPGFGAGWYSWNQKYKELLFDPEIVALVESNNRDKVERLVRSKYGEDVYCGGAGDLRVEWLDEGTVFEINEYDGNESVRYLNNGDDWITA